MATIGSVVITVKAATDGLRKSLKKANTTIGTFAKNAAKKLKAVSLVVGVGSAAAVTAVIATVNKYAAEIDRLAKSSSKLGLPVEALQKLQYQAELTGVSTETMNMALQRMVRRVSEAAHGTGAAKDAIRELGLSAELLNQMSPDEQFYAISEAMQAIGNQGDKVRLAMKIFDTEGVSLVNTMNGNLKQMGAEFDSLGISITGSGAKMVESYNDSKTKLSAIFSGFGLKLTEQLAGPFTKLIEWVTKAIQQMGGMEVVAKNFARFIIEGIKSSISAVQFLINSFISLENVMLRIEKLKLAPAVLGEAVAQAVTGSNVVGAAGERTLAIDNQITENNATANNSQVSSSLDKLLDSLSQSIGDKIDMSDVIKPEHYGAFKKAANDADVMAESTKKATESTARFSEAIDKVTEKVNPTKSVISQSSSYSKIGGLNPGLSGLSISKSSAVTAMESAENAIATNSTPSLGTFKIDMQTDAGKISGELFGEPSFITSLKTFTDKSTNQSARMAAM